MECLYWFRLPPSLLQTPYTGQTDTVPSVFSYLQLLMLITWQWHYTHLLLRSMLRRMPCSNYLLLSGPTAANPPHAIAADEWDGRTDRQTPYRFRDHAVHTMRAVAITISSHIQITRNRLHMACTLMSSYCKLSIGDRQDPPDDVVAGLLLSAIVGIDRRTHNVPSHRPCSTYYTASTDANNHSHASTDRGLSI